MSDYVKNFVSQFKKHPNNTLFNKWAKDLNQHLQWKINTAQKVSTLVIHKGQNYDEMLIYTY